MDDIALVAEPRLPAQAMVTNAGGVDIESQSSLARLHGGNVPIEAEDQFQGKLDHARGGSLALPEIRKTVEIQQSLGS